MRAIARVEVTLKAAIADPQGQTVARSLPDLGWSNVESVRIGKHIEVVLHGDSEPALHDQVRDMCAKLLANPVLEDYSFTLETL